MATDPHDRVALLILRAWVEPGNQLRVRIRSTPDVSSQELDESAVASVDEAVSIVRRWLEAVVAVQNG